MRPTPPGNSLAPSHPHTQPAGGRRQNVVVLLGLLALSGVISAACTEDPLASDPDKAPGATTPTVEISVRAHEMVSWRDTTLSGFAVASEATFALSADEDDLEARILGRFPLPDSLIVLEDTLPVDSFTAASVAMVFDTTRSTLDRPATVRLYSLDRSFDEFTVSWLEAREGEPWTQPGGDLGPVLGSAELSELPDTLDTNSLIIDLDVSVDSLLKAWTASDGEPGVAVVVEGAGVSLYVQRLTLEFEAVMEGGEEPEQFRRVAEPSTFIMDPEQPPTGLGLRLGGIPASRAYLSFVIPDTIGGFPLRGSRIGAAQLVLRPLAPAEAPFVLDESLFASGVRLLLDPFVFGEKTPIGGTASVFVIDPDSLSANVPVRVDVTPILAAQAALPADSVEEVWLGLRALPDGQSLDFWELASVEAPTELQPELQVIFTPPTTFKLPQ